MLVETSSRTCFAIAWYDSEEEADAAGTIIRNRGDRANGGFCHGMLLGRSPQFDSKEKGLYAVQYAHATVPENPIEQLENEE